MIYYCLIVVLLSSSLFSLQQKPAVVIVPVADLITQPLPENSAYQIHKSLPVCGSKKPFLSCVRAHQALYNDVMYIIDENLTHYKVSIPQFFYVTTSCNAPQNSYWILKSDVVPFTALKAHNIDGKKIPKPICFWTPFHKQATVHTLALPYSDSMSKLHFSAGTRFVIDETYNHETLLKVYALTTNPLQISTTYIPKNICVVHDVDHEKKINNFLALLKQWAHMPYGFIPYVWGGTSVVHTSNAQSAQEKIKNNCSYYALDDFKYEVKTGLDCSGMIARAAQIAGIPFPYKNTTTIAHYLQPIDTKKPLESGTIVWIDKHVMVLGDVKNNTLFEARGYSHGYGKVHEIEIGKVFKGIATFNDLLVAYKNKKPLIRLDKNGVERDTFTTFKLLSLESAWVVKLAV